MTYTAIQPIKTEKDYEAALVRIEALMESPAGTPLADELEVLAILVEIYEELNFPMELPDPLEAIRFRMEQAELSAEDLIPLIGSESQVAAVLSGETPLTLEMVRSLHQHLGIPAEVLIK